MLKGCGCLFRIRFVVYFESDNTMGTDKGTLTTLNTYCRIPYRSFFSNITFFIFSCACRIGAIVRKFGNRYFFTPLGNNLSCNLFYKPGSILRYGRVDMNISCCSRRIIYFKYIFFSYFTLLLQFLDFYINTFTSKILKSKS